MNDPLELRVVSGSPDDAELAAVVAVLLAAASGQPPVGSADGDRRSPWGDPAAMVRRPAAVRPGGWTTTRL